MLSSVHTRPRSQWHKEPDDLYEPPQAAQFGPADAELDYLAAPDLKDIGEDLVDTCPELSHLSAGAFEIVYLWKREGGKSKGKPVYGKCTKTSGLLKHFSDEATWIVWLAADYVRKLSFSRQQVEALLFHELLHAGFEEDEEGNVKPVAVGHDWEGFTAEVKRYGAWDESLRESEQAWTQHSLFLGEKALEALDKIVKEKTS